MKPHPHYCPQCAQMWTCRGLVCIGTRDKPCPRCENDEEDE